MKSILSCLSKKYEEVAAFGTLNTMRSAISLIISEDISGSPILLRFFKGIYHLRPSTPRYNSTWDVDVVLRTLEDWGPSEQLDLRKLTLKLTMLLALGSAFRVQSLALINFKLIRINEEGVEIRVKDRIKTTRPGAKQPYVYFPLFENEKLCIARTISCYVTKTKEFRDNKINLLLSFTPRHHEVGPQTISRWLKAVLKEAGISEESKALVKGMNIQSIKETAGWSNKSMVFPKFYNRPIKKTEKNFAQVVLS